MTLCRRGGISTANLSNLVPQLHQPVQDKLRNLLAVNVAIGNLIVDLVFDLTQLSFSIFPLACWMSLLVVLPAFTKAPLLLGFKF